MAKFKSVDPKQDFVALEKELLEYWNENGVVQKYLTKNNSSSKQFSFLDGPITANGPMGVHHAWGRTYKDLWQRYKNMQGYCQRFQNGFDCQGLWVEVEVEKELGLKSKKDIENLVPGDPKASIAKFVQLCKDRVVKYSAMQTEQSKRLGYFMDWENSYYTMSEENNYMIWHFLKKCHERGLIYKGHDSVPWCPRCGTAISQHEMLTEDYKEVTHDSVYVEYPLVSDPTSPKASLGASEYLLVWTTTPWTLPANVAVAVDPEKDYVLVEDNGRGYYLSKPASDRMRLKTKKVIKGSSLVGIKYSSPFDYLPRVKGAMSGAAHQVVATDNLILPISDEEGTGLVHVATGAGTEDFQLGKKHNLPVIEVIDEEANYLDGMEDFTGKNAKDHPELIIDFLKDKETLFYQEKITHRYPACWRCHTELVWRVVDEWYIAMDSLREPMKSVAQKINWIPEFGLKRELDWLDNMHDWLISKKRYWGLALPIWVCDKCDKFEVMGSREELKQKSEKGWDRFAGNTPHKPYIDEIKLKCECGGEMSRIPDVGNPWLDAGIVPFSTMGKEWFPADFITESFPGQFKNWFYSMIAMSTVLTGEEPFKTVLGFATLLAEDGRAMHKSWGNSIEFNTGADKMGVDVTRWMYAKQDPATNMLFGYKLAEETRRRFYLILWNSYKFFIDYANTAGWDCNETSENVREKFTVLDRWVLARLTEVVLKVNESLDNFDSATASTAIEEFIVTDLSTWYIRRCRGRVGAGADKEDEKVFLSVMYGVLVTLTKIMAPITPFISEEIFRNLTGEESVHLQEYPRGDKSLLDHELVKQMSIVREVVSLGHAERKEVNIPVRQPLGSIKIQVTSNKLSNDLLQLIKDELNVKEINWLVAEGAEITVELDTTLTPELEEEGKVRDLARQIQEERKKMGTPLDAEINVTSPWLPEKPELLELLKKRTLIQTIKKGEELHVELA
ncbi:MAG: isoleucyl-tRNA synthetase [Microgenomates group bacterium Gr01-1014_5]|nr:MAG: isoleucyl-tRNA synthetase [Microgenomates group bacterium Gr01-1014_5]